MLVIRKQQIQEFIARSENELIDVVREAIRKAVKERVHVYDDPQLNEMLKVGIARAKSHGLTAAEDIAGFVAIMFEVAPRFDEVAEIRAVLEDERFPPDLRFEQLFQRLSDEPWIEAGKKYDDTFWFPEKAV
ncbi:MAG: hypothetical protein ABI539_09515 [Acidobacteriota bacterium]